MVIVPHPHFVSLLDAVIAKGWMTPAPTPNPQPVVIPSVSFSDALQLHLADRGGVCMGLQFLTPKTFVATARGEERSADWEPDALTWRILPEIAALAAPLGVSDPSPRDALALAAALADQFDQYAHFRPEILRNWLGNKPALPASPAIQENEAWQRSLFRTLHQTAASPHPIESLDALRGDAGFRKRLKARYPRLLVLGSGVLDPLLVEMLGLLASTGAEVEIHVILPSLEYLGHLRRCRKLPDANADPEEAFAFESHPLLQSMGRHAIGTFLLLGKLDDQYSSWPEPGRNTGPGRTLLETLQSDIRAVRPPGPWTTPDLSLHIHSCFGPRRELEVVRDEILRAFAEFPDLKPSDIHIVTPSLDVYAPLVPAVLAQGNAPLAVRLMESAASHSDPAVEALLALLDLARGERFEASRLLDLLQLEGIQAAWDVTGDDRAVEFLRRLVIDSGLTHSLGLAPSPEPGTWGFARERLVAGAWFGPDEGACYPDGSCVLPVADSLSGDDTLREKFILWWAALESTLREWQVPAPPAIWADRLESACKPPLAGSDDALLALREAFALLRSVACPVAVDAGALFDWLGARAAESSRRARVSGCISFGLFRHLQNIPCRMLVMVGMQEGAFPGQSRPPAWDLLRHDPRAWDRNPRIDDRQLFLDALLAPSDRLLITAGTRNPRTGKTEPFSSCVDELLRVTDAMGVGRRHLITEHRLQPFASDYFVPPPVSFDGEARTLCEMLASGDNDRLLPLWHDAPPDIEPDSTDIPLKRLIAFWKDPAAAFLEAQGIRLPRGEEDDETFDRAPLSLTSLQRWAVRNALVETSGLRTGSLPHTLAQLRANRTLPPGALGTCEWESRLTESEPLARTLRDNLGAKTPVAWTSPRGDRVIGELLRTRSDDALLGFRAGKCDSAKHFLEPWVTALLASACDQPLPTLLVSQTEPTGKMFPEIPPEEARDQLVLLLEGYREGCRRPLPYAPKTSHGITKGPSRNGTSAIERAAAEWTAEDRGYGGGEGLEPATALAWRDREPFANPTPWERWARDVAEPLKKWSAL